jgi:hypothetical protein
MALNVFSDLTERVNGVKIDAGWFNDIRTILISAFGDVSGELLQSIGQTDTNQDIVSLTAIDKDSFSKVDVEYMVRRYTDTEDLFQSGTFTLHYKINTDEWTIHGDEININGDDGKITFSIFEDTAGGGNKVTVRYSTTSLAGASYVGEIKTRSKKWTI